MTRAAIVGMVLLLSGCAARGSLPPGYHGGSFTDGLAEGLVWLAVACLLGAGMSGAAAVFVVSTVKGFAAICWAICFGFLATLAGAVFLGTLLPAIPYIVAGLVVAFGGVYGLHHWRALVAWWQGARGATSPAPVVPPAVPATPIPTA